MSQGQNRYLRDHTIIHFANSIVRDRIFFQSQSSFLDISPPGRVRLSSPSTKSLVSSTRSPDTWPLPRSCLGDAFVVRLISCRCRGEAGWRNGLAEQGLRVKLLYRSYTDHNPVQVKCPPPMLAITNADGTKKEQRPHCYPSRREEKKQTGSVSRLSPVTTARITSV